MVENLYILSRKPSEELPLGFQGYLTQHFPKINSQRVLGGVEYLGVVLIQKKETLIISNNSPVLGIGCYARQHKAAGKYVYILFKDERQIKKGAYRGLDGVLYRREDGEFVGFRLDEDNDKSPVLPAHWVVQKTLGPTKNGPVDITKFL